MKNEFLNEILIGLIVLVLAIGTLNPFGIWMPNEVEMLVYFLVVIVFGIFAVFVWREKARDEREEQMRMKVGRLSWIFGTSIIIFGVLVQAFAHSVDPWLIYALIGLLSSKLVAQVYVRIKN